MHQNTQCVPIDAKNTGNSAGFTSQDYQYFDVKIAPRTALICTDGSVLEHKSMSNIRVGIAAMVGVSMMIAGVMMPAEAKTSVGFEPVMVAPLSVSGLQSLSASVSTVSGTTTVTGTVTLTGPAPVGGIKVALKGSSKSETLPAGIVIPQGSSTGTFTITSTGVTKNTLITLKATHNAIVKEATYTRTP